MKQHRFTIFVLTIIFCATSITTQAQTCPPLTSGCLDTTFGTSGGGTTLTYVSSDDNYFLLENSALQSDGKILGLYDAPRTTFGKDVVIRYNADGTLDGGFASGGILYVNWSIPNYTTAGYAHAIATQIINGQEKILVAGSYSSTSPQIGLQVDRYNPDGTLDATFGNGGTVKHNVTYAQMMTVQPDGKILTLRRDGDMVRLNSNGTLDTSFGSGGVAPVSALTASSIGVQSTGRIVLLGYTSVKGNAAMTVARYNINGSPDDGGRKDSTPGDSFGSGGKRTVEFYSGTFSYAYNSNIKIDASDKILAGGWTRAPNTFKNIAAVARLTTNGQMDTTFDGDGKATFALGQAVSRSIALQADGKIVLAGDAENAAGTSDFGMIRLNPNGSLDDGGINDSTPLDSFGANGVVISDFSSVSDGGYRGMIQLDPVCACEKIVALGAPEIGGTKYAIAARYLE
jgi:uncharacterized delta-60 repeat protein